MSVFQVIIEIMVLRHKEFLLSLSSLAHPLLKLEFDLFTTEMICKTRVKERICKWFKYFIKQLNFFSNF